MPTEIKPISLPLPFRMGRVNCYLISTDSGYALIDTGGSNNRKELISQLESAGCQPGMLQLIILTHGDFDHTGNAAYLRSAYASQIAMHPGDLGMAEQGDMFFNRKQPNILIRTLVPLLTGFGKSQRFSPDVLVSDDDDLSAFGFDARVISIPGHSQGSIAILSAEADLFCGDLLENIKEPALGSLTDDVPTANASLEKLAGLPIGMVYPGHGQPFPMSRYWSKNPPAQPYKPQAATRDEE
jgi:glyoxylase-like metal-dependent hydrolase (beta-lactamase superfamily II)